VEINNIKKSPLIIIILEKLANAYAIGRDTHVVIPLSELKEELVLKLLLLIIIKAHIIY
jgi:argininosuccinate synthase